VRPVKSTRELYREFHGRTPGRYTTAGVRFGERWLTREGAYNVLIPESAVIVGHISRIDYDTTRDGRVLLAQHHFAPGSRPVLLAGPGKCELLIAGGRYRFTERGIVDLDSNGRQIIPRNHGR